jgi:hypothetical protein
MYRCFFSIKVFGNDNRLLYATTKAFALWKILRKNGAWEIVNIEEAP